MTVMAIRETRVTAASCPPWCMQDHFNIPVDDPNLHMSDTRDNDVLLSRHGYDVLVNVQQLPEQKRPFVAYTNHEGDTEYMLTPGQAEDAANRLEDLASIIRANGDHTCWCDGMHTPGDAHVGEARTVRLGMYSDPVELNLAIVREYNGKVTYIEVCLSHGRNVSDWLTAEEVDHLVVILRRNAAIARGDMEPAATTSP